MTAEFACTSLSMMSCAPDEISSSLVMAASLPDWSFDWRRAPCALANSAVSLNLSAASAEDWSSGLTATKDDVAARSAARIRMPS